MGKLADRVIEINPDELVITLVRWDLTDDLRFHEDTPLFKAGVLFRRTHDLDCLPYQRSRLYDQTSFLHRLTLDRLLWSFTRFDAAAGEIKTSLSSD
jgi:hypothetical protein